MSEIRCTLPEVNGTSLDVLVVGGGIMGAGIFRRCAHLGYRVLLVEKGDFASGTSSRSSKLVHGGLHYLTHFQLRLARRACKDRNDLLRQGGGLVTALKISLPPGSIGKMPRWVGHAFLAAYRHLGGPGIQTTPADSEDAPNRGGWVPGDGALEYTDAVTDDAGLVLRAIREGCRAGGHARNYVQLDSLILDGDGAVTGASLRDLRSGRVWEVLARAVVNATGIWADQIRGKIGMPRRLRFLRGSHLLIPWSRLPLARAVASIHPETGRPVYLVPWQGTILVGSTSIPHHDPIDMEPRIQAEEFRFLLRWVQELFPETGIGPHDVCSTFSGLRAIVADGPDQPEDASRAALVQEEAGLITVTGGKLTIFPSLAKEVTNRIGRGMPQGIRHQEFGDLDPLPSLPANLPVSRNTAIRILARYGEGALDQIAGVPRHERVNFPGLPVSPAEIRWAARSESIRHLEDLLLRRVRIGLTHPPETRQNLTRISSVLSRELGWDRRRRRMEEVRFLRRTGWAHASPGKKAAKGTDTHEQGTRGLHKAAGFTFRE